MAERYKSTKKSQSKICNEARHKQTNNRRKKNISESTTPPLPSTYSSGIKELMRKRESIKEELQRISINTKNEDKISSNTKKRKYDQVKKTENENKTNFSKTAIIKSNSKNVSPEYNTDPVNLDSEDEEYIIEQRRKQRKQLLEQLHIIKSNTDNVQILENTSHESIKFEDQKKIEKYEENCTKRNKTNDMFSEDIFLNTKSQAIVPNQKEENTTLSDNWDDEEGYYKIKVGEVIDKYTVKGVFGQGVFANVVKAQDNNQSNFDVAIKIIRNNNLMYKNGLKEIALLKEINQFDPDNKYHCVKLFTQFMHNGHLCLVLECMHMDLRSLLKKYGKSRGINIKPVMSYSRQLFIALHHLNKIGIIHADIKPDNILVNEKKNLLKLCDFGSATKECNGELTPYLVSRFYRAPEIILGVPHTSSIDMWSTACTIYEISTGKILFIGNSNNKMIKCFMDLKGKIPNKLLRKGIFKDQHFNYNNNFILHKTDEFTGREKFVEIPNISISRDLYKELLKSSLPGEEKKIGQLKDLLSKMLMLDPHQRLSINGCLKHIFINEELQR